jgi:Asp-tRNA(Asn)/Glu-tRNA(Gln) amidotransferase B subunit
MANRVWAQFFGRGIVDPVDDVRISNPPSNRELLEELGKRLAGYNFDAKKLIRDICLSKTYQLATTPNETNRDDDSQFSHQRLRRLRADVLLDALAQVTETLSTFNEMPRGLRAMQLYEGGNRANYFLKTFGSAARDSVNASETRLEPTLAQALHMVNGDTIEGKLGKSTVIPRMLAAGKKPGEIIDELFVRTLSRKPSEGEMKKMMAIVSATPGDKNAYDDVLWALLNSTEFEFNH